MGLIEHRPGRLNDTIWFVIKVLEDHPEIETELLYEITASVSGMEDREAMRARILELAGVALPAREGRAA